MDKHYINIFDLVFDTVHSDAFKIAEVKDLLFEDEYSFAEKPIDGWVQALKKYVLQNNLEFDLSHLDK